MNKANEEQVGGDHYRKNGAALQHWDLAILYRWDPFQYQITKYVMRWKDKHSTLEKQIEDLKKARHFLDKYIENAAEYAGAVVNEEAVAVPDQVACDPPVAKESLFQEEGFYGDGRIMVKCRVCKRTNTYDGYIQAYTDHAACSGHLRQAQNGLVEALQRRQATGVAGPTPPAVWSTL